MKNLNLFLFAAGTALLTACGGSAEKAAEPVVATYTLDASESTLEWTGFKKGVEEGQHSGTINFVSGTAETTDDVITSGSVTLDAKSIATTDELGPAKDALNGHLQNPDFFDAEKYPTIEVTYGELKDGKLPTTVKVLGTEFKQDVEVASTVNGDQLNVTGKFTFDFEGITSPGFGAGGETRILPQIDFNLNLVFKK